MHLAVSQRKNTWDGVRQEISFARDHLQFQFNFSIQISNAATVRCKLKVENGNDEETQYVILYSKDHTETKEWLHLDSLVFLDPIVFSVDTVRFYLEVKPADVDYYLDNVSIEKWIPDNSWRDCVEQKINTLRKNDIEFNFIGVDATGLSLNFEQLSHDYPFGHAVKSEWMDACYISNHDDELCSHIKENYNWIVDTYRCSIIFWTKLIFYIYQQG